MISNLAQLGGNYMTCKSKIMSTTMDEFYNKKLKDRSNKIIRNKNQAIAIALSDVNKECRYTSNETNNLIKKVNKDLNDKNKEINLSNMNEILKVIENMAKKNKYKRIYIFKKLLWNKIIESQLKGNNLSENIWKVIKKIHKL
jgi:L-lactate utilization protein LutC